MLGLTLSALGNGLVLPFAFVYLHSIRNISTSMAGLIFSYGALTALVVAPLAGSLIDKWGPRPILIVSLIISSIGYSSLSLIKTAPHAFFVITICSIGQSGMWPSQSAISTELTPDHLRERIYGAQFALLNLGLGLGGMFSSLIVRLDDPSTFEKLYVGDGISYLIYLGVVLSLGKVGTRSKAQREHNAKLEGSWADVLRDKTFVKFWLVCLCALFLSYSQMEVGFTSFATTVGGVNPSKLAWAYAVNTAVIAAFQLAVIKRLEKMPRARGIAIAATLWAIAWIFLSVAGLAQSLAVPAIILCQLIFAFGEMVWSPVMPAIANQLAPDHLRGRYNSATSNAWQIGMIMGPASAGAFLGAGLWVPWLVFLVLGLCLVVVAALRLKLPARVMPAKAESE